MAMGFRVKVSTDSASLQGALQALNSLRPSQRGKILRQGVSKAGQITLKEVKAQTPRDTGLLRRAMGRKVQTRKSGRAVAIVGPRKGFKRTVRRSGVEQNADPVFYAHLVELGRTGVSVKQARVLTDGGQYFGKSVAPVRASHFIRRSWTICKNRAAAAIIEAVKIGFTKLKK